MSTAPPLDRPLRAVIFDLGGVVLGSPLHAIRRYELSLEIPRNAINRVVINVGVAYGSDTAMAKELLLKVAADNDYVLEEPSPIATFEGFGDSTLDFVLRCYLPNLDNRLTTVDQLHSEIHARFAEAGLEIAFPQQDIHIRSLEPPVVIDNRRSSSPP